MPKKISKRNYFSLDSYLSSSKLKDYKKCPAYFFAKHVLGNIPQKITDPLILGSACDLWLTSNESKFREKYYLVSRRLKSSPDYRYQLNQTMFEQVENICRVVEQTKAYKEIKGFKKQQILQWDEPIGQFEGLKGMLDFVSIKGNKCIIVDLKTAESIEPNKYFFKAMSYGYFTQMAMYKKLVKKNYPEINEFEFRHLSVEKDSDEIYRVGTFLLDEKKVDEAEKEIDKALEELKTEKKFLRKDASWEGAITI